MSIVLFCIILFIGIFIATSAYDGQLGLSCFIMFCAILLASTVSGIIMFTVNFPSKTGNEHVGYITAVETESFITSKTKIYVKTDLSSSQEDTYCINPDNKDLINKAKSLATNKSNVVIQYDEITNDNPFKCGGDTVTNIILK